MTKLVTGESGKAGRQHKTSLLLNAVAPLLNHATIW